MKLIVAGMSKTGTKSIAKAMKILGYDVHDTMEHFRYHRQLWYDFLDDKAGIEDVRKSYEGVDVATDMPSHYFWEQLHQAYPEAKILFSTREDESWVKSAANQYKVIENDWYLLSLMVLSPTGWQFFHFLKFFMTMVYGSGPILPFTSWRARGNVHRQNFRRHNAHVLMNAPKDKLLVFNVKEGWGPLCEFMGVEVPQVPFPHQNVGGNLFEERLKSDPTMQRMKREARITASVLFISLAAAFSYAILL